MPKVTLTLADDETHRHTELVMRSQITPPGIRLVITGPSIALTVDLDAAESLYIHSLVCRALSIPSGQYPTKYPLDTPTA